MPAHSAQCFVEADWPLIGGSFVIADVAVLWPKKLAERLVEPGAMTEADASRPVIGLASVEHRGIEMSEASPRENLGA